MYLLYYLCGSWYRRGMEKSITTWCFMETFTQSVWVLPLGIYRFYAIFSFTNLVFFTTQSFHSILGNSTFYSLVLIAVLHICFCYPAHAKYPFNFYSKQEKKHIIVVALCFHWKVKWWKITGFYLLYLSFREKWKIKPLASEW